MTKVQNFDPVLENKHLGDPLPRLKDFLSKYKDGWEILIKASHAKTWEYPVPFVEGVDATGLPTTWLGVVERICAIIAEDKYSLSYYPNVIEIITPDQMMDAYTSAGMPVTYEHWSFGKSRAMEDKKYNSGGGLAYEIVINTDPCIAYCMENNSPLMQILVIAHASFGHNNFFKENMQFTGFTEAQNIVEDLKELRDFVHECEELYGWQEVERHLNSCHALRFLAVDRYERGTKSDKERKNLREQARLEHFSKGETSIDRLFPKKQDKKAELEHFLQAAYAAEEADYKVDHIENIMMFIADNAPFMPEWKRKIMRMISNKERYFYPNGRTQVMNEGWASFWHWTILHDLSDYGLIDDGMMMEFMSSHSGVLYQPDYDETRPVYGPDGRPVIDPNTGEPKQRSIYSGINPYALGFALMMDIKRICLDPTEEDKKWFPYIAGQEDWLSVLKQAMKYHDNESFIRQYMSPQVMRDFKFFAFMDDCEEDEYFITGIHDESGFEEVRDVLASQYNFEITLPQLDVVEYHKKTDRHLVLQHNMVDWKLLNLKETKEVLRHLYRLWGYPVVINTVEDDGHSVIDELSCPAEYVDGLG